MKRNAGSGWNLLSSGRQDEAGSKFVWPFSKKDRFPGVKINADGAIDFTLTKEEASAADLALHQFKDVFVHPEVAEKVRNGTIAVALCRYATNLIADCDETTGAEYNWSTIQKTLEKAVAAVWKSYSLCPLPIFLYHRAAFLQMLGVKTKARRLFALFLTKQSEFKMDQIDKLLLDYEATDIERALSHAKGEA